MNAVEIFDLTKVFDSRRKKSVTALKNINISVPEGIIFGLLGPNGAGKTTLVKILLGITFPTSGNAGILGEDLKNYKIKKRVGYLPENHKFPAYLTGEQVLKLYSKLSGYRIENIDDRISKLLRLVKMSDWKNTKIKKYSKGMLQRIGLAQAMVNDPDLLILDEPTDGVDPIGRKEIRDILIDLKKRGKTIFLNSHLLSEVELITDRIAILNKGELIEEGTVEDITSTKETYKITLSEKLPDEFITTYSAQFTLSNFLGNSFTVKVADIDKLNKLIDIFRESNIQIISILPEKKSLEDMFISLISKSETKIPT